MSFHESYRLTDDVLGKGSYGEVKRAVHNLSGQNYAVKTICSKNMRRKDIESVRNEIGIANKLSHRNLVQIQMHGNFFNQGKYFLVFDLVIGGELFDDIVRRDHYSETEASKSIKQVLEGINYCHQQNIIHRDMKPENILLSHRGPNATIKIADFGLAVQVKQNQRRKHGLAGTPSYIAPEVIKSEAYGIQVDMWSVGIILYILLVGYPPFWEETQVKLYEKIILGEFHLHSPEWDTISPEAKQLVCSLIVTDSEKRLTARAALNHVWVRDEKVAPKLHRQATIESMSTFNAKRKLKAAMTAVMTARKLCRKVG